MSDGLLQEISLPHDTLECDCRLAGTIAVIFGALFFMSALFLVVLVATIYKYKHYIQVASEQYVNSLKPVDNDSYDINVNGLHIFARKLHKYPLTLVAVHESSGMDELIVDVKPSCGIYCPLRDVLNSVKIDTTGIVGVAAHFDAEIKCYTLDEIPGDWSESLESSEERLAIASAMDD
jgi:hypothetical protein